MTAPYPPTPLPAPPKPMSHKQKAAATLVVGTGLTAAGGSLRHSGVSAAEAATHKRKWWSARAVARTPKGRARYLGGVLVGTAGGAGMGLGAHELVKKPPKETKRAFDDSAQRPKVDLQRHAANFVGAGIAGNREAFGQRVANTRAPVPVKVRAKQVATSTAAGGIGSLAAHRIMDRRAMLRHKTTIHGRHAIAAVAGTSAIIGSLPVASRMAHKDGYEFTPTGVKRRKTPPVRPTRSKVVESRPDRSGRSYSTGPLIKRDGAMDLVRPIFAKTTLDTGQTQREQREQLKRKKHNLGVGVIGSTIGATGVGLLAARELGPHLPRVGPRMKAVAPKLERAGLATALAGGGIGSVQSIQGARIAHRDLKAQSQVLGEPPKGEKKASLTANAELFSHAALDGQFGGAAPAAPRAPVIRASNVARRRGPNGTLRPVRRANGVAKIETTMDDKQAKKLVAQHGAKGPLPKHLDRATRMKAYEARYVAAGGPKGEKWRRRADNSDHVTGALLAVGGGAGLTELTVKHPKVSAKLVRRGKDPVKIASRAGRTGIAAGTAAAGSELFHRHASHRQASYASSPAGVAASALHRMRDYSP